MATKVEVPLRPATTQYGSGFLPQVMRSMLHPLVTHTAIADGVEQTNAQVAAALGLANDSLATIPANTYQIMSADAATGIENWKKSVEKALKKLEGLAADDPADDTAQKEIKAIYAHAFILLGILDEDLLGLRSDGGTTP